MKINFICLTCAIALSACTNEYNNPIADTEHTQLFGQVTLSMTGIDINSNITRASLVANDKQLTDIFIIDCVSGIPMRMLHQTHTSPDFAEPTLSLPYGDHSLICYATRSTSPSILNANGEVQTMANVMNELTEIPTLWYATKISDTFLGSTDITVNAGATTSCTVSLNRIIAQAAFIISDVIPDNASKLQLTFSHYADNCILLIGSGNTKEAVREVDLTSVRGNNNTRVTISTLTPDADKYYSDVSVSVMATDGTVLSQFDLQDVPLHRNHVTTVIGSFFAHSKGMTMTINDRWDEDIPYNF